MKKTPIALFTLLLLSGIAALFLYQPEVQPQPASRPAIYADQPPRPKHADLPKSSGAGQALDRWWASRAYPEDRISQEKWAVATEQHIGASAAMDKTQSSPWESMGPHNIGGRTLTLEFNPGNPNTIYLGSACGGLWLSRTAGVGASAWQRIPTGFPVLGVAAIAINPSDTNEIYIGTGEVYNYQRTGDRVGVRTTRGTYGIGILKTTDGGATWSKSLDWQYDELRGVQDLHIHPTAPNQLLAATSEGIYKSTNSGSTWSLQLNELMANDFVQHPADPNTIFAGVGNMGSPNTGVYKSTDFGSTWTKTSNGLPSAPSGKITLAITQDSPYELFASVADSLTGYGLYISYDEAANWSLQNNTNYATYQGWYSHDVAVNPFNRNWLMCVGVDAYKSMDGGFSLGQVSYWYNWYINYAPPIGGVEGLPDYVHADIHQVLFHPTDPNTVYFATDGGVFVSHDQAQTFQGRNGSLQTTQFYSNTSSSRQDSNLYIGGLQDNGSAVYNGNKAWYRVIGGDGCSAAIRPDFDGIIFGSYQYLGMMQSTDRGLSFDPVTAMPQSAPATTAFVAPYVISEANPDVMYAGRHTVEKSTDGGTSWTLMNGGQPLNGNALLKIVVDPSDENRVFASTIPRFGQPAQLFRTTDGGAAWANVTGSLPDRYYNDMAVNPVDPNEVFVVLSGFGSAHLYKSSNGGNSWTAHGSGLPDVPHNNLVIDPLFPSNMYIANDLGVYSSLDGGQTWAPFGTGLPEAVLAMDLEISATNRKLRLATHGNGVYQAGLLNLSSATASPIAQELQASLAPNPAATQTNLVFSLPKRTVLNVKLTDMQGRTSLIEENREFGMGDHRILLSLQDRAAGTYFITLSGKEFRKTLKLVISK